MTLSDTTLKGFKIPKGMLVFINQYAANHDSDQWDKPDEFIPERFLDRGELIPDAKNKYLLFSYGSRKCPGDKLSMVTLLHMTGTIFHTAEFQSDPKRPTTLDAVYNLSMRPKLLRTKIRIRKPLLLDYYVLNLSHLSPYISTVDPQLGSFGSGKIYEDFTRFNSVNSDQPLKKRESTDREQLNVDLASFHPKRIGKTFSGQLSFQSGLVCNSGCPNARSHAKSLSRK